MKPEIITVSNEESALLQEAARIEQQAHAQRRERERCASEKAGRPVREPLLFFDTPEEAAVVQARDQLREEYAERLRLETPPILIPPNTSIAYSGQEGNSQFHRYERYNYGHSNQVLPEELKDRFLDRVPTFRDGERLYLWSGTCYRYRSDNEVKAAIKRVLHSELRVANAPQVINTILMLLKIDDIEGEAEFPPHLVAVQNGQIDLRTLCLHQATPSCRLVHYLNVPWVGAQPCPVFDSYLYRVAGGDPELIQRFWEAIGFLLVSDRRAKRFALLQGAGDCGKSALGNLLISFFEEGSYASLGDYRFGDRFSTSTIAHAHICVCMDLPGGVIDGKAVSVLKQVTGGDVVAIEAKGHDAYTGRIHCKICFGSNYEVTLKSRDEAFARRILLLPFRFPLADAEKDRDLESKLSMERSGVLYKALLAYREVVNRNFVFTGEERFGFKTERIIVEDKKPEGIDLFIARLCVLEPDSFTPIEVLHGRFNVFCEQFGLPGIADRASFSRALNTRLSGKVAAHKRRVDGIPTNGYVGIRLREEVMV